MIVQKTLWEKEKLLVTSNFSFSHNVFKSCLVLMCQNENLWSKGLTSILFTFSIYTCSRCIGKTLQIIFIPPTFVIYLPIRNGTGEGRGRHFYKLMIYQNSLIQSANLLSGLFSPFTSDKSMREK